MAANAAAAECDPEDSTLCAQDLKKGQMAPFDGQLLTPSLAIKLGQKADRFDRALALEVKYVQRLAEADLDLEKKLHGIDNEAHVREMQAMQKALDEAQPPFYERPWFVSAVTAVLTVASCTLSIWGASQLH